MNTIKFGMLLAVLGVAACGSNNDNPVTPDAAPVVSVDAPIATPDAGPQCFTNPTTHLELINACTNAQAIDKHPNLPLLLDDGGLPPLP